MGIVASERVAEIHFPSWESIAGDLERVKGLVAGITRKCLNCEEELAGTLGACDECGSRNTLVVSPRLVVTA